MMNAHICCANRSASRTFVRGRRMARAIGPAAVAATVAEAGIR